MKINRRQFLKALPAAALALTACGSGQQEAPATTDALVLDHAYPLDYARQFTADVYTDGSVLLTIAESGDKFLVRPEGAAELSVLPEGTVELRQPLENIYLVSSSIMDYFIHLDALDSIALSGTRADGWYLDEAKAAMDTDDKNVREARWNEMIQHWHEKYLEEYPDMDQYLEEFTYKFQKKIVKAWLLEGHRVDGRQKNEIRPLSAEVGVLPRVHGSGLFTRGQTQVLSVATLDTLSACQKLDTIWEQEEKRYMHHYNFPSYSVGEARGARSVNRREKGHGALAERALDPVIPSVEDFPYAIRVVSEVVSSNGSTSQGSICGSTLALMDAGVPIKAPVAGISCGLITEGDRWMTMLDIQGVEDFHGDMDFKVGGTRKGITAIQMDIKIDGLTYDIIAEAFEKCRKGRLYILDEIIKPVIAEPRRELSRWAPKMFSMMIPTDKIKDVIGKGGKVIQDICATCNCKIDVQEDGHVFVSAVDQEDAKRAIFTIRTIVEDPEIGAIYKGKVTRLMNFGAFVEIAPGKEGLVHISKLDTKRVERVEDVVAVGDAIVVKVTDIDQQGRINLSRRDAILALEAKKAQQEQG